jgi:hypothetical protein
VRSLVLLLASLLALSGCQGRTDPPGDAPTGVTATPGDGLVVISWDVLPDLTYWIFYEPGSSVAVAQPGSIVIRNAIKPRPVAGLLNGTQYAFAMNATHNDSAAGPSSPPVVATPRLAGDTWTLGTPLGTPPQNLRAIATNGSRFVVVGDAATIFAGDFSYTNVDPPGMTAWLPPTVPPPGITANFSAVAFSSIFVALGSDGSVASSPDGFTWTTNNRISSTGSMNGIAFGFVGGVTGTYVAVGDGGQIFTSTDLGTWTPVVVPGVTSDLKSVALVNGNFVVTGSGGTLLATLTPADATSWTTLVSNTPNTLRASVFSPLTPVIHYVAVGDAGTIVTSPDGVAWTPVTLAPPIAQNLLSVTVGGASGSRILAVGQGGAVVFSDDGVSWSQAASGASLSKVVFVPSLYLAVGDGGANAVSR